MFIHHVYFWLKKDAPTGAGQRTIDDCKSLLSHIPGVVHLWAGRPAMTPRDVVDNTYDAGLCVVLADVAAHEVYQKHSLHLDFIARNRESWDHIRVYDFQHDQDRAGR